MESGRDCGELKIPILPKEGRHHQAYPMVATWGCEISVAFSLFKILQKSEFYMKPLNF